MYAYPQINRTMKMMQHKQEIKNQQLMKELNSTNPLSKILKGFLSLTNIFEFFFPDAEDSLQTSHQSYQTSWHFHIHDLEMDLR